MGMDGALTRIVKQVAKLVTEGTQEEAEQAIRFCNGLLASLDGN